MVLSCQVQDPSFSDAILTNPSLELISKLGGQCDPGLRLPVVEIHCQQLRKLFKDFVKPAELPKKVAKSGKKMVLDGSRAFPPVRGCVFTEGYTCVHFMTDPAAGFGLPRGTFVYASSPLPQRVSYRGGDIFFLTIYRNLRLVFCLAIHILHFIHVSGIIRERIYPINCIYYSPEQTYMDNASLNSPLVFCKLSHKSLV